jgi:hypothetical protein
MPDCPKCKTTLAFYAAGGICPECRTSFTPSQIVKMPDYDGIEVAHLSDMYILLTSAGLLKKGLNKVELYEEGMLIENTDD